MEPIWAIGLMTGTVLDGNIDIAMLRTDGETVAEFGPFTLSPYAPRIRQHIEKALMEARDWGFRGFEPPSFRMAEDMLTRAQTDAVKKFVEAHGRQLSSIGVVGFHGQSVLHRAPRAGKLGATRQLGDGKLMQQELKVPVVFDFRTADVKAGGQGAPLAASYHQALLRKLGADKDTAVLNLGGVANITWWDGTDTLIAFDVGPANAPSNDWVKAQGLGEMDKDGALAASGTVDEARLGELLEHSFLSAPYPKSLDRFSFTHEMAEGLSPADGAATLAAFTAAAVGKGLDLLPHRPKKLIVCGGGRKNPTIMAMIKARAGVEVAPAEDVGWRGDAIEAECFAFLAVRALRGLPISFPTTTGVPEPMTGGQIVR